MNTNPHPLAYKLTQVGIANFADLGKWQPQIGDFVVFNGWVKHWFGVISEVGDGYVDVVASVLPVDVFLFGPTQQKKHTKRIDLSKILLSRGGKFAIIQVVVTGGAVVYVR